MTATAVAAEVRSWWKAHPEITRERPAPRGPLPKAIVTAYNRVHPQRPYIGS